MPRTTTAWRSGCWRRGPISTSGETGSSQRPPGYPAFVAGVYLLFGIENYAAVRAAQALLSLLTVVCVYLLGKELYSPRIGFVGGGRSVFLSLAARLQQPAAERDAVHAFCDDNHAHDGSGGTASVTWLVGHDGALLGLGALVRSILWLFAPLLSLFVFLVWPGAKGRRAVAAAIPLTLFVMTLAPWAYRNTVLQKTFTVVDVMGGRNAMMGNYEYTPLERNWATISIVQGEKQWHRVLARGNAALFRADAGPDRQTRYEARNPLRIGTSIANAEA